MQIHKYKDDNAKEIKDSLKTLNIWYEVKGIKITLNV